MPHIEKDIEKTAAKIKYNAKIEKFMQTKTRVAWSRSLSDRQMLAADNLLSSLHDDMHQDTTHRVRFCLVTIGIDPIVGVKSLNIAIQLSQGNDLAFLWFLLELFYIDNIVLNSAMAQPLPAYTINQQLIMSVIAHLDMITTLRELDQLIPNPKKLKKSCTKKPNKKKPLNINEKSGGRQSKKPNYASVYLQPLVAPKVYDADLAPIPRSAPARITPYEKYADPQYIVPNEHNRWFAHPEFQLYSMSGHRLSSINIVRALLGEEFRRLFTGDIDNKSKKMIALCHKHKEMEKEKKTLMNRLQVAARDKCLKYFSNEQKTRLLRERFQIRLEKDLDRTRKEFEQLSQRYQTQTWLRLIIHELVDKNINLKGINLCDQINPCTMDSALLKDILQQDKYYGITSKLVPGCKNGDKKQKFDYGHEKTPKPNEKYFYGPKKNAPYKFHYSKLFEMTPEYPKKLIQNSIGAALNIDNYLDEDEAIAECLKRLWKNEVKLWNEKFKTMDDTEDKEQSKNLRAFKHHHKNAKNNNSKDKMKTNKKVLFNEYRSYDPRDNELMESMLKKAFNHMKQNPKFVLASLPDAFKMQTLNEWLKRRFGLIYTPQEKHTALLRTIRLFYDMRKHYAVERFRLPKITDIGNVKYVPYRCRNYVFHKIEQVMKQFTNKVKLRMMADPKIFWEAFEPYHWINGPPRELFYAYLPSKESEVLTFRPWNGKNCKDVRKVHELRKKTVTTCATKYRY